MKVSPRTINRRRQEHDTSHRVFDILGILFIALALITTLSLTVTNNGVFGSMMRSVLSSMFGRGAWAVPPVFIGIGLGLIKGRRSVEITHLSVGLSIIFFAILAGVARQFDGDYFDPRAIASSGGYFGAVMGWGLESLLGAAKPIGIGALGMVGLVMTVRTPIIAMMQAAKERAAEMAPTRSLKTRAPKLERERAVVRVPEVTETTDGLYNRALDLARTLNDLDQGFGAEAPERIKARLVELSEQAQSEERDRQFRLLEQQFRTATELTGRRQAIADRLESSVLAMQNVRFDLIRVRSSGVGGVIGTLTQATQAARALSRDVDHLIAAASEVKEATS